MSSRKSSFSSNISNIDTQKIIESFLNEYGDDDIPLFVLASKNIIKFINNCNTNYSHMYIQKYS